MPPLDITNSLLRIDRVTGLPPFPFERPNETMDFFVLELGQEKDVQAWCVRTAKTLSEHSELLRQMLARGAQVTLFVQSRPPLLRLEPSFLDMLAKSGIALSAPVTTPNQSPEVMAAIRCPSSRR